MNSAVGIGRASATLTRRGSVGAGATTQLPFGDEDSGHHPVCLQPTSGLRAIECDSFPFEVLSEIAEAESWRKEINRPTTHIHKWWAQRLGTVFRAMVIGAFAQPTADVLELFYKPLRIPGRTVFDPFMGSGTTLAETVKLGATAIGCDINPVAHFLVKCALSVHDRRGILETYRAIERDVADEIRNYYRTTLPDGTQADVLYVFWVKVVDCPVCATSIDLFRSRIFARHAYPKKVPQARAVCPHCDAINEVHIKDSDAQCCRCGKNFNPNVGPVKGQNATCPSCNHSLPIAKTIRASGKPPVERMYAKLVLLPDGAKEYQSITSEDKELYDKAARALANRKNPYPVVSIRPGYNTNQVLAYNYRYWHEMFNARQLLCLSILAERIRIISDAALRDLFTCLFSGALEFNNMFASYKGEGTGAVRHMFAHHILKPERVPLEANVWGTRKSSGSFSTMFEGRIRRALDYADNPFELRCPSSEGSKTEKVYGLSERIGAPVADTYQEFARGSNVYLLCKDSSATDLPEESVDAVLTDPPFFDNVHYSQLADFFYVWQRHILGANGYKQAFTTRSENEVQNVQVQSFTDRLCSVWVESHRVLKNDGILAFTYHHSRPEGWRSVLHALMMAGFTITAAHPIKAELSVAMPKRHAKEPIDIDIIVVCRKRTRNERRRGDAGFWTDIASVATEQVRRFVGSGRRLSRSDVRVIVMAQLLRKLSVSHTLQGASQCLDTADGEIESLVEKLHAYRNVSVRTGSNGIG